MSLSIYLLGRQLAAPKNRALIRVHAPGEPVLRHRPGKSGRGLMRRERVIDRRHCICSSMGRPLARPSCSLAGSFQQSTIASRRCAAWVQISHSFHSHVASGRPRSRSSPFQCKREENGVRHGSMIESSKPDIQTKTESERHILIVDDDVRLRLRRSEFALSIARPAR